MIPASGDMMSELPPAMQGMRRRRFVDKDGDTFYATGTFRHIRLEWAGASIVFRNEDADRIAALILAVRPEPFSEARITAILDEAVEAAAEWLPHSDDCEVRPERDCTCWHLRVNLMRGALESAAPHLLSHEREQTRLAHLDAMVNRETKQAELAAAWDEGHEEGYEAGRDRGEPERTNPYRKP